MTLTSGLQKDEVPEAFNSASAGPYLVTPETPSPRSVDSEGPTCEQCSQLLRKQHWGDYNRFCSRNCYNVSRGGPKAKPKGEVLPNTKACIHCGEVKPLDAFYVARANRDGRQGRCKACHPQALRRRNRHSRKQRNIWRESKLEKLKLKEKVAELRAQGYCYGTVADELGIGTMAASMYAWEMGVRFVEPIHHEGLVSDKRLAQQEALVLEQERQERAAWKQAACEYMDEHGYDNLPWHPRKVEEPERSERAEEELQALVVAQEKEAYWDRRNQLRFGGWNKELPQRRVLSLDEPVVTGDGEIGIKRDRIPDPRELDPFLVLAGATEPHLEELLGSWTEEEIERADHDDLQTLRQRLIGAGLTPSVQQKERERLGEITPHRGSAPPPSRVGRAPRHRGRNEASDLHKTRGKRFKRREKNDSARDGWGGVVEPEDYFRELMEEVA